MNISTAWKQYRQLKLWLATTVLTLCFSLGGCSQPGESANTVKVSPEFEQQVIQVIRDNPEAILESVQAYQQQQQQNLQSSRESFLEQMKTDPGAIIGSSPTTGASSQEIVLLEFSDFQCPFCSRAHQTIKQFMDKHQGQVTLVYKHLPLSQIHPEALPAAKASWAAQQQGKFWEYQDALFTQQEQLGEDLYLEIANNLNLDLEQFNRDRQSQEAATAIQKDLELAQALGISGTPFFVMNGETFSGAVELSKMEEVLAQVSSKS
ncbi:DSBA-like thioredoxin domain protein [Lyngbya aestuarii BL J]|uniref:DSBA-like thioredoxin domain protein n=1 Tax=Lyngbya aestuarii BL J TaxID=1348334 RepID=U7QJT6_9CYAN|nr:thioredoxin domain-containing protein [Lyngbya aestuarii]ERT07517.1 DSBA-like thioredoxin domain protein [Lyngbya aestuarii BL J]